MSKKRQIEAKIATPEEFAANEVDEQGLFFVVFNGDAIIEEGHITFLENEAMRIYHRIMSELIEDYASAPNLKFKNQVAQKIAGLTVQPLRLH